MNYLPSQIGKLKKPDWQVSHLALIILDLQLHMPLALQLILVDPCVLQLQAKILKKGCTIYDSYINLVWAAELNNGYLDK